MFELPVRPGALAAVAGRFHAGTQVPQTILGFVSEPEVAAVPQFEPVSVQHWTQPGFVSIFDSARALCRLKVPLDAFVYLAAVFATQFAGYDFSWDFLESPAAAKLAVGVNAAAVNNTAIRTASMLKYW
jgi:hypothetical protein